MINQNSWIETNRLFSLTKGKDLFGDINDETVWRCIETDTKQFNFPPLFIIKDVLQIIQSHRATAVKEVGLFQEELLHSYRNLFIYNLIHNDASIAELHRVFISKGKRERRSFVPFVIHETARRITEIYNFKFTSDEVYNHKPSRIIDKIVSGLNPFLIQCLNMDRLFTGEQINIFAYIRKEEDIPVIKEYSRAKSSLLPIQTSLAKRARSSQSVQVEVDDMRSPSMGGISGISAGGSVEKISSIVPSELAMMEKEYNIDLFDVNLIENRLLSFTRDHYIDIRRQRSFHLIFMTPESMHYRPQVVPFGWQFFFMAIIFDIISFYSNFFNLKRYPFHFVFPDKTEQTLTVFELVDIVKSSEFPDIKIESSSLKEDALDEKLERIYTENPKDQSICCFIKQGYDLSVLPEDEFNKKQKKFFSLESQRKNTSSFFRTENQLFLKLHPEVDLTFIEYGGTLGRDEVNIIHFSRLIQKEIPPFIFEDHARFNKDMCKVRDTIFLCLSGAAL